MLQRLEAVMSTASNRVDRYHIRKVKYSTEMTAMLTNCSWHN